MLLISTFVIIGGGLAFARPNDWDVPCFHGECSYDLPLGGSSGHIKIMGHPNAIADITPAAGWVVLECDPNALSQDVRLVCNNHDMDSAGCTQFFGEGGPVHKYVRLPESCGKLPFARIANYWVHDDQNVPSHHDLVTRRDGAAPQVYGITIDNNWDEVDESKYGPVIFAVLGSSASGLDLSFDTTSDIDTPEGANDFVENAIQLAKKASDGKKADKKTDKKTADKNQDGPKNSESKVFQVPEKLKVIEIPIRSSPKTCSVGPVTVTLGAEAKLKTQVTGQLMVSLAATGNAKSKKLSAFKGHVGKFNLDVTQELEAKIELDASIEFNDFQLIPPIGVPGASLDLAFLKLGLQFEVLGHLGGSVHVGVSVFGKVSYGLKNGQFDFPKTATLNPYVTSGAVKLALNPEVTSNATFTMGIAPRLKFGVSAFGKAEANLYVSIGGYVDVMAWPKQKGTKGKPLDAGGQVLGRLQAVVGAEASLLNLFKSEWDKTLWNKKVTFWKSGGEKKRETLSIRSAGLSYPAVSRRSQQAKFSIPVWKDTWLSCSKVDSSKKENVVDKSNMSPKELGYSAGTTTIVQYVSSV